MAHLWHDLGKAACLRSVMMVLGDRLRAASFGGRFLCSLKIFREMKRVASLKGVSANPTKANHFIGLDKVVGVAVKNDNDYIAGPNLIPQRKEGGKWVTLKTNSPNPLKPGQKDHDEWSIKEAFGNKKGTYRFKVDAERYDKNGNHVETIGTFYTSEFYIK